MSESFLITRPKHDDTTHYLSCWSKELIDIAESRGMKTFDLHRQKAVKEEVESRLIKFSPKLVVLNGHGDENTVTGHKNQPLIIAGKNEHLLKSKIVYAISCRSAKVLGAMSIKKGTLSYTGYLEDFVFVYEPENLSRPLVDRTAELFLKPSQSFVESILKGNTVNAAHQRATTEMKNNFLKVLGSKTDAHLAKFLWWNMRHFRSLGNVEITL